VKGIQGFELVEGEERAGRPTQQKRRGEGAKEVGGSRAVVVLSGKGRGEEARQTINPPWGGGGGGTDEKPGKGPTRKNPPTLHTASKEKGGRK